VNGRVGFGDGGSFENASSRVRCPLARSSRPPRDDNRLTSLTYGGVTDLYYYKYTGQRYRARLNGTYYRYLYNGERVLEELNDSGTMQARYTTEDDSYYGQWVHLYRPSGSLSRFPMYDNIGSARGLLDASGTATDWYELDTFGRQVSSSGTTPNPYRFGGAWGYITDTPGSGLLQLGARFYWPEVGRFVSQDPDKNSRDWYAYVRDNPGRAVDPTGWWCWHIGGGCIGTTCKGDPACPPAGGGGKGKGGRAGAAGGGGTGAGGPGACGTSCPTPPKPPPNPCKADHPTINDCFTCDLSTEMGDCCNRGRSSGWSQSTVDDCFEAFRRLLLVEALHQAAWTALLGTGPFGSGACK